MTTAIVGAGAIGGSLAAHLADGGWSPLLVDADAAHVAEINRTGLSLKGNGVDLHVRVRASTPAELNEPLDEVFLCVKSQDTVRALERVRPLVSPDGYVLSLQNGLNQGAVTAAVGRERTMAGFVNWAADFLGPGRIRFGGRSHFVIGELDGKMSERLLELERRLRPAFPAVATDNIGGYLWSKQVSIALMFSAGVSHRSIPEAFDDPGLAPLFGRIAAEGMACAAAEGATLPVLDDFDPKAYAGGNAVRAMQRTADHYRGFDKQHTGLYRDLAVRRRPSEVDGTLGVSVRLGARHQLDMRAHERVIEVVHDVEEGKREVGEETLHTLRDNVAALGPFV